MAGAGIAPAARPHAGRWIAAGTGLLVISWIAGWAGAMPPSTEDRVRPADSSGGPSASSAAESPAGRVRGGPRTLAPVARRRPAASPHAADGPAGRGHEAGTGGLRVGPGRWRPLVAAPGMGVPVEAIIDGEPPPAGPGGERPLQVFVLSRVHPQLPWTRIAMRPLATDARRFQAVLPCGPCHARPEYRFEASIPGDRADDGGATARWPEEVAAVRRYDVGHEFVRHAGHGAVLRSTASSAAEVGAVLMPPADAWLGPVWSINGVADPIFAGRWIAIGGDAASHPPRLMLAMRAGAADPWVLVRAERPFAAEPAAAWIDLTAAVRTHLGAASQVQVAVWAEADSRGEASGGRLLQPRLLEIRCSAATGPDVDGDGLVGLADLLLVFEAYGPCDPQMPCEADVDGDGRVDLTDVMLVVSAWGGDGSEGVR